MATKEQIVARRQVATKRYILATHPVFYTALGKDSGGTNQFLSDDGKGHLCIVTGATLGNQGRTFDGSDDYIDCGSSATLGLTSAGTLRAWVKPTGTTTDYRVFISRGDLDTTRNGYLFDLTANLATLELWLCSATASQRVFLTVNAVAGTWYCFEATWDSTWINVYQNGTSITAPVAQTVIPTASANNLYLGKDTVWAASKFKGTIGEAFILNRVSSAIEAMNCYQRTKWRY